jgi:hypothetical protein
MLKTYFYWINNESSNEMPIVRLFGKRISAWRKVVNH